MVINEIFDIQKKQDITKAILEALTDWFGVAESRGRYIRECGDKRFWAAFDDERPVGFICLNETGKDTAELHVMGVLKEYHRNGIGKKLFEKAREAAAQAGYSFMQVKTVKMGMYDDYDRTNRFYLAIGFKEFEVFPTLWDEANPCQVYVMALRTEDSD